MGRDGGEGREREGEGGEGKLEAKEGEVEGREGKLGGGGERVREWGKEAVCDKPPSGHCHPVRTRYPL